MDLQIRCETAEDIAAIDAVTVAAFANAPHTAHTEQYIVRALRAAGALWLSLVAERQQRGVGRIVGHVALSNVAISDGSVGWFGLGPLSVSPEHQGLGIGTRLMHEALRLLRERGAARCVLLGDPAYYARFGFAAQPSLVLLGVPAEYFQALALGAPLPRGIVTYHAAFAATA